MNLVEALAAIGPAVGDGKLIPQHAYAMAMARKLHATDGRQWAQVPFLMAGDMAFCVRYEALKRALERDGLTALVSDSQNGLKASYGRGRATLKGVDPATFPTPAERGGITANQALPPDFTNTLRELLPFAAGPDGHVWQQAVHLQPDYMFAANAFSMIKRPMEWQLNTAFGIPTWACRFIVGQAEPPIMLCDRDRMISFVWANGVELFTTLLTEQAPEQICTYAAQLPEVSEEVPEGLKESIARLKSYGVKTCKIGNGKVSHISDEIELEDDVEISGAIRTWGVDSLSAALEHATALDLTGRNGAWRGSGFHGVFGGRSD